MVIDISDIQILPIIVTLALPLAGVVIFLLFKFMMKEKTYEEALAEQRTLTNELLGVSQKPKEKKSKKAKKNKEKVIEESPTTTTEVENTSDENEITENNLKAPIKPHVEFKEEAQQVEIVPDSIPVPPQNKQREDVRKSDTSKEKEKQVKEKKPPVEPNQASKKPKQDKPEKVVVKDVQAAPVPAPAEKITESVPVQQNNDEIIVSSGKDKKKKKTEFNAKQQLALEGDQLISLVRKAELSRTEIQNLIDLLLNKQLEAPEVSNEWSEGKSDPVQKLKKQLAEKEKLLADEQEALLGAQSKLKEIRAEHLSERSQLQLKIRSYEESLQQKQLEIQACNNRAQVNVQKIQQLQDQLNEEIMTKHKIIEDNKALQMQRQQLEVHLVQIQEADAIILKLKADNEELAQQHQHLSIQLQGLVQEMAAEKEQKRGLVLQLTNKQVEVEQISEHSRQLEEARKELERSLEAARADLPKMSSALQQSYEEKMRLERNLEKSVEEIRLLHREKSDYERTVAQLKQDVQKLREEKTTQMNGTAKDSKEHEIKVLNLTNELSSLKSELSTVNSTFLDSERKYKKELENTGSKVASLQAELNEQKEKNNKLVLEAQQKEQDAQRQFIQRLFPDIQEHLQKIETTNWQDQYRDFINNYLSDLQKRSIQVSTPEPSQQLNSTELELQAQVIHYKNTIDELEGILGSLQFRIGEKERDWERESREMTAKIEELQNLLLDAQSKSTLNGPSHLESSEDS